MGCYARSGVMAAAAPRRHTLLCPACRSSLRVVDSQGHQPAVLSRSVGVSSASIGALHLAAWHGDGARVQQLLADSASVHVADADGWTAAHYAVRGRSLRCLAQLLAAGAPVSAPAGPLRHTPLHFAAAAGEPDLVAALLAAGSCAGTADAAGRTPLTLALQHMAAVQAAERSAPYQLPAGVLQKALAAVSLLQGAAMQAPRGQPTSEAGGSIPASNAAPTAAQATSALPAGQPVTPDCSPGAGGWLNSQAGALPGRDPLDQPSACSLDSLCSDDAPASAAALSSSGVDFGSSLVDAARLSEAGSSSSGASASSTGVDSRGACEEGSGAGGAGQAQRRQCSVCLESVCELLALIPCGHRSTCTACTARLALLEREQAAADARASSLGRCPLCREAVSGSLLVFDA